MSGVESRGTWALPLSLLGGRGANSSPQKCQPRLTHVAPLQGQPLCDQSSTTTIYMTILEIWLPSMMYMWCLKLLHIVRIWIALHWNTTYTHWMIHLLHGPACLSFINSSLWSANVLICISIEQQHQCKCLVKFLVSLATHLFCEQESLALQFVGLSMVQYNCTSWFIQRGLTQGTWVKEP